MLRSRAKQAAAIFLLVGVGCGNAIETPGLAGATASGAASSTGSGGSGGQVAGINVNGLVSVMVDSTFNAYAALPGMATVMAQKVGGGMVSAPCSDDAFALNDVDPSSDLFLLETAPSDDVMPTLTLLPAAGAMGQVITIWGARRSVLQEIATSLSMAPKLDDTKAQILFAGGQGPGIRVKSATGAVVAYGQGAGMFSDTATATGASGLIILFNVAIPPSGVFEVVIEDATNIQSTAQVRVQAGVATIDGYI